MGCQYDEAEEALRDAERLGASAGQVRDAARLDCLFFRPDTRGR